MDGPVPDFGGLTTTEAQKRLVQFGPNEIRSQARTATVASLVTQFKSPIVLILIGAAVVSLFLQANTDAILIIVSAALIVLVVRTRRPLIKSRPSKILVSATLAVVAVTLVTPFLPFAPVFGFGRMPPHFYAFIALIVIAYIAAAEIAKRVFYRAGAPRVPPPQFSLS